MPETAIAVWGFLFGPAVFAFVVGGGYWAYAQATSSSLPEAGERFKLYTWLLFPAASLGYAVYIALAMPAAMRETLLSGMDPRPQTLLAGVGAGLLLAFAGHLVQQRLYRKTPPQELQGFMTPEWRELPGLVVIAPIAEELVFRGYGSLALSEFPVVLAALITSAAFALIHVKPALIAISFFIGLALFALLHATGDLITVIIAHAAANAAMWLAMRRMSAKAGP